MKMMKKKKRKNTLARDDLARCRLHGLILHPNSSLSTLSLLHSSSFLIFQSSSSGRLVNDSDFFFDNDDDDYVCLYVCMCEESISIYSVDDDDVFGWVLFHVSAPALRIGNCGEKLVSLHAQEV